MLKKFLSNKSGFTLIEILIASMLFSGIALFSMTLLSNISGFRNSSLAYQQLNTINSNLNKIMDRVFRNAEDVVLLTSENNIIDWTFMHEENWRIWDIAFRNWGDNCEVFDIADFDLIWLKVEGQVDPVIIWVRTIENSNWSLTWQPAFYQYKTIEEAAEIDEGKIISEGFTDEKCENHIQGIMPPIDLNKDIYSVPNVRLTEFDIEYTEPVVDRVGQIYKKGNIRVVYSLEANFRDKSDKKIIKRYEYFRSLDNF